MPKIQIWESQTNEVAIDDECLDEMDLYITIKLKDNSINALVDTGAWMNATSSVETKVKGGWIEADECMEACGLTRMTLGLHPPNIPHLLCSSRCSRTCPHLHYLLNPLSADQGSSIAELCLHLNNPHHRFIQEGSPSYGGYNPFHHGDMGKRHCHGSSCGGPDDGFARSPQMANGGDGQVNGREPFNRGGGDGWTGKHHHPGLYPTHGMFPGSMAPASPIDGDPPPSPSPSPYSDDYID
ncbi:hypothetical protein L7F22_056288 [Adiantum nelumboides]|nr:hypothetical protein [Adiantum nelumboides]